MDITANRLELLSAVQNAEHIAPANPAMKILGCACLATENGKLTVAAGNLEAALEQYVPVHIQNEGALVLNAKLLAQMLRLLDGDDVSISQQAGAVTITGGQAVYRLSAIDAGDYPRMEIPFPEDTVTVSGIPNMARRTVFAVSEEESRPLMKCVHLSFGGDGLRAVGSDGYRIAAARGESKSAGAVDMLLPASSLEKLARLVSNKDQLRVGATGNTVVFMKENFAFSARLMRGNYFDAERMMGMFKSTFTVLTDAALLRQALVSVYSVNGKQNRFSIRFEDSRLRLTCESELGASSTELEVVALSGAPSGEYWYNPQKLLECLKAQSGTMMVELAQNGALVMRTDELVCMQIAMRQPRSIEHKTAEPAPVKKQTETGEKKPKPRKKKNAALPEAA